MYLFIYLHIYLVIYLLFIYCFIYWLTYLYIFLFIYLFIYLSVQLFTRSTSVQTAYVTIQISGRTFKKYSFLWHNHNLNYSRSNIKGSSIISVSYHYFLTQSHSTLMHLSHLHSLYNRHKQKHHTAALLISLQVIQTLSAVDLTYFISVDSCCHCTAYNLQRQATLYCTLGIWLHVSLKTLSAEGNTQYICQLHSPSICPPT